MKKISFLTLFLVLNLFVVQAAPLTKPSSGQIKQLIKKQLLESKTTIFVGISNITYKEKKDVECENIKVQNIKILKIGRASSSYYKQSGSYIGSNFKVKFSIQGSCKLSTPYRLNTYKYQQYQDDLREFHRRGGKKPTPVIPMDLKGRLPFRSNVPFEVYISTDDYGDWYANGQPNAFNKEDSHYSVKTEKYLANLFYKTQGTTVKKWEKKQALAKSKMSFDAESGLSVIKYDNRISREVKAQLRAQPKHIKEFVYSTYWKLSSRRSPAKAAQFIRQVTKQMKLKTARTKLPRKSVTSSSSNSHSHGGRRHTHKLPTQGISHRHGNGPIGRK